MSFAVVIPARYASSRLPGKPLLDIAGKPMVQRVWERAMEAGASEVIVATDDERIVAACESFAADVVMTSPVHPSGTDRLQEVAQSRGWAKEQIIVNVQGDEPMIPPALIRQVADNLATHTQASIATLSVPVLERDELTNPNAVKVITDKTGIALYFSRATIPWPRDAFATGEAGMPAGAWFRHIGIYAYRAGFLHRYVTWPPAPPEQLEQLEQLRALYNGERIHVAQACEAVPPGVDTQADLDAVRALLEADDA